jgi:hypothetical protein
MAIWPFNRKQKQPTTNTSIPAEVQDYYNAQHRERVGVAWLIAVVSLLISVAVVIGLFFGGRWAYRKIVHKKPSEPIAVQEDTNKDKTKDSDKSDDKKDTANSGATDQGTAQPQNLPGDSSAPPQSSSTNTTTPQVAGKTPDTGPGNTIAVFAIASIAGTAAYQVILRRRTTQ